MTPAHPDIAACPAEVPAGHEPPGSFEPPEISAVRAEAGRALPANTDIRIHDRPGICDADDPGELTLTWLAGRSPGGRQRCLGPLASWLDFCSYPLTAGPEKVERWLDGPYRHYRPELVTSTGKTKLDVVRSWYAHLHRHGACRNNPAARVKAPPSRPSRPRPALTCVASALLVDLSLIHAKESGNEVAWRDHAVLATLFHTGLPAATLAALAYPDHLVGVAGHGPISVWTATLRPEHTLLDLDEAITTPLRAYLELRTARENTAHPPPAGPMFGTAHRDAPTTRPLTTHNISKIITAAAGAAGLPPRTRLTPHRSVPDAPPAPPVRPVRT